MSSVFAEVVHVRMRQIEPPDGSKTRGLRELLGPWWESHAAGRTHSPSRSRDGTGRRRFCEYLCVTNGFFTHFTPSITVVHLLLVRQQLLEGYCSFSTKKKTEEKRKACYSVSVFCCVCGTPAPFFLFCFDNEWRSAHCWKKQCEVFASIWFRNLRLIHPLFWSHFFLLYRNLLRYRFSTLSHFIRAACCATSGLLLPASTCCLKGKRRCEADSEIRFRGCCWLDSARPESGAARRGGRLNDPKIFRCVYMSV